MAPRQDLNIFILKFDAAKAAEKNIGAGDPFYCELCKVCLNKFSKIMTKTEYMETHAALEKKELPVIQEVKSEFVEVDKPYFLELGPNDMAWVCEFCGHQNRLRIEK